MQNTENFQGIGEPWGSAKAKRAELPIEGRREELCRVHFSRERPEEISLVQKEGESELDWYQVENLRGKEFYFGVLKARVPRKIPKCTNLKIGVMVTLADGKSQELQVLVDTGAEVNLVNSRLISPELFQPATRPLKLGVANSHVLPGG